MKCAWFRVEPKSDLIPNFTEKSNPYSLSIIVS